MAQYKAALYATIYKVLQKQKVPVFLPGEREYELSVATANLLYRFTRPDCVAQPETVGEVEAIVRIARERGVSIIIKGGGHSYAGFSTTDNGILLDLKRMNEVSIETDDNGVPLTVTIQAGAKWGDVYRALVRGQHNGYVINGGRCPSVGVGGFILGGGLGPFTRKVGMGCDTLLEATIVTVKGDDDEKSTYKGDEIRRVTVTSEDAKEARRAKEAKEEKISDNGRLFWALCGGGAGNFGVVTEIKMAVKKLKDEDVVAGRYTWYPLKVDDALDKDKKEELLKKKREALAETMSAFYTADWAPELTIDSNWIRDIKDGQDSLGIRFTVYFDGTKPDFDAAIDRHIKDADLAKGLKRRSMPEASTRFFYESLVLMWEEESRNSLPRPGDNSYQLYNSYVFRNTEEDIKGIIKTVQDEQDAFAQLFKTDNCTLSVTFIHTGGKVNEMADDFNAYRWRSAVYHTYVTFLWKDKWVEESARGFLAGLKDKLRRHSIDKVAAFINFADATLEDVAYEAAYYGENIDELKAVKKIWDKEEIFTYRQAVKLRKHAPIAQMSARMSSAQTTNTVSASIAMKPITSLRAPVPLLEGKALRKYERLFTDSIAKEAWKSFEPPPSDYVNIY